MVRLGTAGRKPAPLGAVAWGAAIVAGSLLWFHPSALAQSVDAGTPSDASVDSGTVTDGEPAAVDGSADSTLDASSAPTDPLSRRLEAKRAALAELRRRAKLLGGLRDNALDLPTELRGLFSVDLVDAHAVTRRLAEIDGERRQLEQLAAQQREQLAAIKPLLEPAAQRLSGFRRRKRRHRRLRIPKAVVRRGEAAEQQLELLALDLDLTGQRHAVLELKRTYLVATQAARAERQKQREAETERLRAATRAALEAQRRALAESAQAEKAVRAALESKRKARTEAERQLAEERARLEGIRAQQAKLKHRLAEQRASMAQLRSTLEVFRGRLAARFEQLQANWPTTAPEYDEMYDDVVARLVELRPMAVAELRSAIRRPGTGIEPGAQLSDALDDLPSAYQGEVQRLEQMRQSLARAAAALDQQRSAFVVERLSLLHREITALNEHRLHLLNWITKGKRYALVGLTRETFEQLGREVTNLVFDGLYWAYSRLRQIDEVPRLLLDVFTVGSMLWTLVKLVLVLLLLRFTLNRWQPWIDVIVRRMARSISLGRNAVRLARLADAVRSGGAALLVLIAAILIYRILGGNKAAAELRVVYIVVFWTALYRLQLRLVESVARQIGISLETDKELAAEAAKDETDGEPEAAQRRVAKPTGSQEEATVPVPVLLVRSVRAATRYLLAVLLVLDLTALAVGQGTLYGLTAGFSWLAAFPFIFYFLHLWKPHIVEAYRQLSGRRATRGTLARLVDRSLGRFYGIFVVGAAFTVLLASKVADFVRRYFTSLDATKKLLAFLFRRQVEKHAQELGHVLTKRHELSSEILAQFPEDALSAEQLPVRQPFMDTIKEVFDTWRGDQSDGSVVLVGRDGMGKSTAIRLLEQELGTSVLRGDVRTKITRPAKIVSWLAEIFGFSPKPSSERDLIRSILEDTRPVVAIDNCHNLFLRQVNGFKGWDTFVRIVNETCGNVFWLLTFNQAAWEYVNNVAGHVRYFRRLIPMPAWSENQIRKLIMQRMRRSRWGASFSDLVMNRLEGFSAATQLGRTSAAYFRLLWDQTAGNPRLAGHFWLNSLVPEPDRQVAHVQLFATPQLDELEQLSDDILFVLTAVTEHQNLTATEAANVTNLPSHFCNFAFKYCLEKEYLHQDRQTGRFRLGWRWQVPIVRFLKRRHLLYG